MIDTKDIFLSYFKENPNAWPLQLRDQAGSCTHILLLAFSSIETPARLRNTPALILGAVSVTKPCTEFSSVIRECWFFLPPCSCKAEQGQKGILPPLPSPPWIPAPWKPSLAPELGQEGWGAAALLFVNPGCAVRASWGCKKPELWMKNPFQTTLPDFGIQTWHTLHRRQFNSLAFVQVAYKTNMSLLQQVAVKERVIHKHMIEPAAWKCGAIKIFYCMPFLAPFQYSYKVIIWSSLKRETKLAFCSPE